MGSLMATLGGTVTRHRAEWRYPALCISAILIFVAFHVYRMAAPPVLVSDFGRAWRECAPVPSEPESCSWSPVSSQVVHSAGKVAVDHGHYRHTFFTPRECQENGCSLMLENMQNIASVSLNGLFLASATAGLRIPIVQTLPPEALAPPAGSNTVDLITTGGEPTVVARSSKLGLVVTKSGQRYLAAYSFHNVFAPLAGAIYLLIIAALSAVCPVPGVRNMPIFKTTLNYCALSSAFLFNLSATVQEVMPQSLSIPLHCMLRFSCDWCFAVFVLNVYYVKSKWLPVLHGVFGSVVTLYGLFAATSIFCESMGWDVATISAVVHTSILITSPLILCGALIGLFYANSIERPAFERALAFAGFVTLLSLQVRDLLVNLDYVQGSYASRTYPLVIGLVAAGVLNRRATLLHADERLASEATAMSIVAGQVAHDIRSPLAALNMVTRNLAQIPEENRVLVREAVNRINEIANSLTFKNIEGESQFGQVHKGRVDTLEISPLVDVIVTECQIRLPADSGKSIKLEVGAAIYGVFVMAQSSEVKRLLCNLINNGVEAVTNGGEVRVAVQADPSFVSILINDNGPGIPPHIVSQLGTRGKTFGKKGGSGLGLYHAKTCLEGWGGALHISEGANQKGVLVEARFARAATPFWHLDELQIAPQTTVVVVDDDQSIHEIWRHRLRALDGEKIAQRTLHFDSVCKLKKHLHDNPLNHAVYLVDLEINGVIDAGLQAVVELSIEKKSIIVTSRADDIYVKDFCHERGVKLLNKRMAEFLPLKACSVEPVPDVILIDDDELVHSVWRMAAKRANRKLLAFKSREEFVRHADNIPRSAPVYVDYNLGGAIKGDAICRELLALGYKTVHIATGEDSGRVPHVSGVTSVTGKEPPASWA